MNAEVYHTLHLRARQALLAERMKTSAELQVRRMSVFEGVPDIALVQMEEAIDLMRRVANGLKRECKKICVGEPIYDFVEGTMGLSTACFVFLGCLPPMDGFKTVSKVWKYTGLFVTHDGRAPTGRDLSELKKENPKAGWSPELRAHAIVRLSLPCIKMNGGYDKNGKECPLSPYRQLWDDRKARTMFTHPSMLEEGGGCEFCDACYEQRRKTGKVGWDCSNITIDGERGHHWRPSHRKADADRYVAKAIIKDLWLVENGLQPVVGGQSDPETQNRGAPSTDIGEVPVAAKDRLESNEPLRAAGA